MELATQDQREHLSRIYMDVKVKQNNLETEIMRTPSGELRNKLCDINIHLGAALSILTGVLQ